MTAKQILDGFSEALMQDERILSPRERELLSSILQNSKAVSSSNPGIQAAVTATMARSVGETVAQRAFALLGSGIVEKILAGSGISGAREETAATVQLSSTPPTGPFPPGAPQPPQGPGGIVPQRVNPSRPSSLHVQHGAQGNHSESVRSVGVLDAPATVRAQCVVLDEFLAPQELEELISYTLQHEADFQNSAVVSPSGDPGTIDYQHRRSRVLMDLGKHEQVAMERVRRVLPQVLEQLGMEEFPVTRVEAQVTASNDGDFFGAHCDDSQETIASRRLTFVYFFNREPRQFEGGELRLHDSRRSEPYVGTGSYETIMPQQNQIVFFPCSVLHEITPVECLSRAFADSRFTLNGWLHS